jgi:hypothetical protein
MRRAGLEKAACFISAFLLVLEIMLTGCAPLIPPEIISAEDSLAAGKELKSTSSLDIMIDHPDIEARKKIILIVNSVMTDDYSTTETKNALKAIQNAPDVSRDIRIEAGYIMSMIETIDRRNKDIDHLQHKVSKCLNEKSDLDKAIRENELQIIELIKEKDELDFKLGKLEEIYKKSERRRGLRK